MRHAEQGLRLGYSSISELTPSVGYTSESAFSNAFERTTGVASQRYGSSFTMNDPSTPRQEQTPGSRFE
jgi:AraC-like DNA-binding protein